jgi:hypothetical protein
VRLAADSGLRRARMTLPERGAAPAGHRAGLSAEHRAPGRRLPRLGPPGHGGVGARVVPDARRTGWEPQRSAPGARAARAGHPPGAPG